MVIFSIESIDKYFFCDYNNNRKGAAGYTVSPYKLRQ